MGHDAGEPGALPPVRVSRMRAGREELLIASFALERADDLLGVLSRSERRVVALALAGLSDEEIATRRRCSKRTIANQLGSAYRKLGVRSRIELAARLALATAPTDR